MKHCVWITVSSRNGDQTSIFLLLAFADLFELSDMLWTTKGLQGIPGVYKGLQGIARVYKGLQGITGASKGLQGITRVYKGLQGYITREIQENTREYKRIQGNTLVNTGQYKGKL